MTHLCVDSVFFCVSLLPLHSWSDFVDLCKLPGFEGLREDFLANVDEWRCWAEERVPHLARLPGRWGNIRVSGKLVDKLGSRPTTPSSHHH